LLGKLLRIQKIETIDNFNVENVTFLCFNELNAQILKQDFYFKSLIKYSRTLVNISLELCLDWWYEMEWDEIN